jgi:diaminohydroxyphosphoribosylaminopyrimidine deaminase / 5-amino-6-(5-phosphoribosylamino)uracil reductase
VTAEDIGLARPTAEELVALRRARDLALRARGRVSPNPLVGAVILRDGATVAEGWHEGPGRPHAEAMALDLAGEGARGATVVCTLEPCSHHGRTPPCAHALVTAGVARVVIGCADPLERDRDGGVAVLRDAGVEVVFVAEDEADTCRELISDFLTAGITGRPEVTVKMATSLDGKVATVTGESRWISGPGSRALVHRWRADADAVAVGIGTALADDPRLTARDIDGPVRQPIRVVFDGAARLPIASALARGARDLPVVVVAGGDAPDERVDALSAAGVEVMRVDGDAAVRTGAALDALGARGVQSLFVEGGAGLAAGLVQAGVVDRVAWFLAPMLIGGVGAPSALGGRGVTALADAPRLRSMSTERVGDDILVRGRLRRPAWAD